MAQLSLFDFPKFKITKKIRLIELFGGIGSQAMALRDIGADFEHYKLVEFDKYAVASYNAIHDTRHTTHDIRQIHASDLGIVDKDKYCYLMTYSFPCTDLSVAGKMQGMSKKDWEEGNSTRSGLLWEVERILKECSDEELPDVLLMENVPQVHAEQNKADFDNWLNFLKSKGYWNFWKDLNAKDFGIPQNRDRCFCVSILSKDFVDFEFPEPIKLEKVMKDYLEESVDEKYYINTGKAKALIRNLLTNNQENQICVQINYNNVGKIGCKVAKALDTRCKEFNTGFQLKNGVVETIDLSLKNPKKIKMANCISARNDRSISNLKGEGSGVIESCCVAMRGRNPEKPTSRKAGLPTEQRLEKAPEGMLNTLTTVQKDNLVLEGVKNEDKREENLLQILRGRIEKEAFCKWAIRGLFCILQTQILQQNVYAERLFENWKTSTELEQFTHNGTIDKYFVATTDSVRDLWKVWETECSSYRRKFSEQQFIEFKSFMQKLPHEDTQTKIFMFCLWEASEGIWVLRKALSEIQEIWKPTSDKQGSWSYRIRKLTSREVWRLMGYTDRDFEKAAEVNSNTQLYKQAGNAIVKQVLMAIFSQLLI